MGVTRVQIGIQHTNDRILTRIKRRCTAADSIRAMKLLRDNGFKVDVHLMPDLPKPFTAKFEEENFARLNTKGLHYTKDDIDWSFDSIGEDERMFNEVFRTEAYQPDQVKIYPCEVMDWTGIKKSFENGTYVPYGSIDPDQESNPLIEMLIRIKSDFPEHIRINRLIRDIPEEYVLGGIKDANGRQRIEQMMRKKGLKCKCMRCREIKKAKINPDEVTLKINKFRAGGGDEYFLQYVTKDNQLVGFLRLRISPDSGTHTTYMRDGSVHEKKVIFPELVNVAMIRELHVYGEAVQVNRDVAGTEAPRSQQHVGYGTRLLRNAFILAKKLGYEKMSVISGEGVKPYYRRFGFYDGKNYLLKDLTEEITEMYVQEYDMDQFIETEPKIITGTGTGTGTDTGTETEDHTKLNEITIISLLIIVMVFIAILIEFIHSLI
jgi:histone acetyltransferase (RNA polymerase elongator complex component)